MKYIKTFERYTSTSTGDYLRREEEIPQEPVDAELDSDYDYKSDFIEGYAKVLLNKKWGFIDEEGNEIIPCKYDNAGFFSEGLAKVMMNKKWGYVNETGEEVIPCKYEFAEDFIGDEAEVFYNNKSYIIDQDGNETIMEE